MVEIGKIPTNITELLHTRLESIILSYSVCSIPSSYEDVKNATNLVKAISNFKNGKISFKELDTIAVKNGGNPQPIDVIQDGIDYSTIVTYQQIIDGGDTCNRNSSIIKDGLADITDKVKVPVVTGKILQVNLEIITKYMNFLCTSPSEDERQCAENIGRAISDYMLNKITFRELYNIARANGMQDKPLNAVVGGIDYSIIATYDQIKDITSDDVDAEIRGYRFNGNPAHPEFFKLDIDKFTNKNDGQFKYACPKVGGRQFVYCFSNQERDEEDGDFWIELKTRLMMDTMRSPFEIKVVLEDGELIELNNYGIRLSTLMWLSDKDCKYEMAIIDKNRVIEKKVLEPSEIETFKSYTRAFIEALEGQGDYIDDLNAFTECKSKKNKGCAGMLILPLLALSVLIMFMIS